MKIGFIGAGNMGGAIIRGFIKSGKVKPSDINVIRKNTAALNKMTDELGICGFNNYNELIKNSDIVFMAVKPVMFPDIIDKIKIQVNESMPLIVSMAAGLTTDKIRDMFGFDLKIIRVMPNINAEILMSATSLCKNSTATEEDMDIVKNLFDSIGMATEINENMFSVFSAIAGCSPAYVYTFIDALARGAQKMGMQKGQALEIAAMAVAGSANMFLKSNEHPQVLVDKVCSPGGTTIEGLCTLEEYKFTSGIVKAVENIVDKDKKLNK